MKKILAFLAALALAPSAGLLSLVLVAVPGNGNCTVPTTQTTGGGGGAVSTETPPESKSIVFPMAQGTYVITDRFGPRIDPISGEQSYHYGLDLAAPDGTPILAVADGIVTFAGIDGGWGGLITIEHTIGGERIATAYVHMWAHGIHVSAGDRVTAGQHIADVGSSGYSTGPHLHLEVRPGGTHGQAIDPEPWLAAHGAIDLTGPGSEAPGRAGCTTPAEDADPGREDGDAPAEEDSREAVAA